MATGFKCFNCNERFRNIEDVYDHIEEEHEDSIPKDFSVQQYYYYQKTGRSSGKCIICKNPTGWNYSTNKYHRFCKNPKCKEKYREQFKSRMIGKYGKVHLLNDPEKQREMLANRKISGVYKWSDGTHSFNYTGSYELEFLRFLDLVLEYDPEDIISPSPHNYTYTIDGVERFYFPDFYLPSISLEIEVKDGGENPNTHPGFAVTTKLKEAEKDKVMTSQNAFNFIKITDKNHARFVQFMELLKEEFAKAKGNKDQMRKIFILDSGVSYSKN